MQKGKLDMFSRSEMYEERYNRFLNKIRAYQKQEVKKIQEKSKDQIQFESNKILSQSHQRDNEAFGKRNKALDVETKIKKSRKVNEARLSKMKTRFEMIQKVQNQIKKKLVETSSNVGQYKELLKKLVIQGMIKMLEQNVEIKCLARDISAVRDIIPECEKQFADICEVHTKLKLSIENLPESDLGGIILTSFQGKIVCNNTLKARLDYAIQQSLPEVRRNLFSSEQKSAEGQPPNKH